MLPRNPPEHRRILPPPEVVSNAVCIRHAWPSAATSPKGCKTDIRACSAFAETPPLLCAPLVFECSSFAETPPFPARIFGFRVQRLCGDSPSPVRAFGFRAQERGAGVRRGERHNLAQSDPKTAVAWLAITP